MTRRTFLGRLAALTAAPAAVAVVTTEIAGAQELVRLAKSDDQWRRLLPRPAFDVLFEEATERAGSSPLNREHRDGTYICAACYSPLFASAAKYESGTGWPSFFQPLRGKIDTKIDFKLIWPRTEYHCARCGGHQGHLFSDGPKPTGDRYCNNGVALSFVPEGEPLPALRT